MMATEPATERAPVSLNPFKKASRTKPADGGTIYPNRERDIPVIPIRATIS